MTRRLLSHLRGVAAGLPVALALGLVSAPPEAKAQTAHFAPDTARTLGKGRAEAGVFQRLRIGLSDRVELAAHPLVLFAAPHVGAKVRWTEGTTTTISTRHTADWPTPLMSYLAKEGTLGLLPPDEEVPQILGTSHHVLVSMVAGAQALVTARAGVHVGTTFGKGRLHDIELPLVLARTAHYRHGPTFEVGLDVDGSIGGPFLLNADLDLFRTGHESATLQLEGGAVLRWRISSRYALEVGARWIRGEYPYGVRWHWVPLVDWLFAWRPES